MRTLLKLVLVCVLAVTASAQTVVGGRWIRSVFHDSMTNKETISFSLFADQDKEVSASPFLVAYCKAGKLDSVRLQPDEVVEVPDVFSTAGDNPSSTVGVRVDDKYWVDVLPVLGAKGPFQISNGLLKKILQAKEVRFRYGLFPDEARTTTFHPAGIDRAVFARDCGMSVPGETLPSVPLEEAANASDKTK